MRRIYEVLVHKEEKYFLINCVEAIILIIILLVKRRIKFKQFLKAFKCCSKKLLRDNREEIKNINASDNVETRKCLMEISCLQYKHMCSKSFMRNAVKSNTLSLFE